MEWERVETGDRGYLSNRCVHNLSSGWSMVRLSSSNNNWLLRSFPWLRTQKAPWLSQWRLLSNLSNLAEHSTYLCALFLLASSTPFLYVIGCWALCFEMSNCSFISFQVCFGTHNKLDRMICVVSPLPPTLPLHLQRSPGETTEKKRRKMSVYVKPLLTSSVPKVDIECPLFSFDFDAHLCSTVGEAPNIGGRYLR